jgi:hypothetical protein
MAATSSSVSSSSRGPSVKSHGIAVASSLPHRQLPFVSMMPRLDRSILIMVFEVLGQAGVRDTIDGYSGQWDASMLIVVER